MYGIVAGSGSGVECCGSRITMAAAPVSVTGALPITVVPVLLDALAGPVLTASPVEADSCDDDAGAGFEHAARDSARTIPAQPSRF